MLILLCTGLRLFGLQSQFARCTQERVLTHQDSAPDRAHLPSYSAPWRPQVHYTPDQNWLNDPNGLFIDENGLWHMYYQYANSINPGDAKDWGHSTSHDLYSWANEPIAIAASHNGSIWSGSTVIDVNNTSGFFPNQTNGIVATYTNWKPAEEAQAIAYSHDGGYTFVKYSGNPVISLKMHGFRDPKVIWHEKTRKWVMAVSHADAHFIEFYTSTNLTSWTKVSTFSNPAIAGAFECPQFIPIPFRSNDVTTLTEYYILVISLGGGGPSCTSTVKYFPGTFNGTHFVPVDDLASRILDFGPDFYATSFFYNLPVDSNPVSISWAANLNYAGNTPTGPAEGWRSAMTVARTHYLSNITSTGYDLVSEPYNIAPMYDRLLFSERRLGNGGLVLDYSTLDSGAVSLGLNFTTSSSSASSALVEICFTSSRTDENITLSLAMSSGSSSDASSSTATFKMSRANISGWTSNLPLSTSSVVDLNPVASNASSGSRTYDVRSIMDRTILEAFVNGGVDAGTMIFFPSRRLDTIVLKIDGLGSEDFVDFDAWGLKSGWSASGNGVSADKSDWKPKPEL